MKSIAEELFGEGRSSLLAQKLYDFEQAYALLREAIETSDDEERIEEAEDRYSSARNTMGALFASNGAGLSSAQIQEIVERAYNQGYARGKAALGGRDDR